MDDGHLEITESDLTQQEDRLRKASDDTDTLIDLEKGIFVSLGIPVNKDKAIIVPDKPHVFVADELHVVDRSHPSGVVLSDTSILMAHGERDQNDRWNFVNGQSVVDTAEAYNEYARKEQLPGLEFIVACNDDPTLERQAFVFQNLE